MVALATRFESSECFANDEERMVAVSVRRTHRVEQHESGRDCCAKERVKIFTEMPECE